MNDLDGVVGELLAETQEVRIRSPGGTKFA